MADSESFRDRLLLYLKYKKIATRSLEKSCGFSNGYFHKLINYPSEDKIRLILSNCPDIDPLWLLTGEGEMLRQRDEPKEIIEITANEKSFNTNADEIIKELTATIRSQQEMIKQLTEKLLGL